jgi:hypothetical protein
MHEEVQCVTQQLLKKDRSHEELWHATQKSLEEAHE